MRNLILIAFMLFGFLANAQDKITVIHFNYKWNSRNDYNLRGLQNAKVQYAWLEEQPQNIVETIKTVPVIVILGKDGRVKMQYAADLSFKIQATKEDIQKSINRILIEQ
jgi:hypothetical protein|tara:strand:+ start:8619 stop:8945 length:327 start_codon:yes stop_codon:yes gene_type:complete